MLNAFSWPRVQSGLEEMRTGGRTGKVCKVFWRGEYYTAKELSGAGVDKPRVTARNAQQRDIITKQLKDKRDVLEATYKSLRLFFHDLPNILPVKQWVIRSAFDIPRRGDGERKNWRRAVIELYPFVQGIDFWKLCPEVLEDLSPVIQNNLLTQVKSLRNLLDTMPGSNDPLLKGWVLDVIHPGNILIKLTGDLCIVDTADLLSADTPISINETSTNYHTLTRNMLDRKITLIDEVLKRSYKH